ncbi:LysR family transcriptional regulator [Sphingomonas oleivorans]|uniref:LysR family transcriptional regulator n=1 Tax=Sphingomonas oleivorans TaxID=1735121 RepID=A0A2T5FZF3_9SPHN|nr:LysR family transcriptional regulator [Sphingomonas oleivorans]PTQ12082.1 LysR family transcriptional regulator [Sphingomonas oleivorans]
MIFGRAAIYFDEVARQGSIRRASEMLRIAPSAIDRQILQLEQHFGAPLFERTSRGLRMTTAGEMLAAALRNWRRDLKHVSEQIDDLTGLRRGEVSVALIEGAAELLKRGIASFHQDYPHIVFRLQTGGAEAVLRHVMAGECDIGLTANAPQTRELRIERTLLYRLGLIVLPDHPLARRSEIGLVDCAGLPLIVPDASVSLRGVLDKAWARTVGGKMRHFIEASGITMVKSLVASGVGAGIVSALDVMDEVAEGQLAFVPLSDTPAPLSILSLVSASGRTLSAAASLFIGHLSATMLKSDVPAI